MTVPTGPAGPAALPRPPAFVLGGGAGFGAAQVGMVRALEESGVHPDLVVGTSVGALNGAVLASNPGAVGQALEDTWLPMRRRDVFPGNPFGLVWRLGHTGTHAMESAGLQALLAKVVQASTFEDLALPLSVVTVDMGAGCEVVLERAEQQVPVIVMPSVAPQRLSPMDFSHTERLIAEAHRVGEAFLRDLVVDGPGIYGDPYERYAGTPVGATMTGTGSSTGL